MFIETGNFDIPNKCHTIIRHRVYS